MFYQETVTSCWIALHAQNMTEMHSASLATGSSLDPRAMDLPEDPPVYLWTQATPISKPAGDESFLDT